MKKSLLVPFLFLHFALLPPLFGEEAAVLFQGCPDEETKQLLESSSQLTALKKRLPKSQISLKRRAEQDIPRLIKALHSKAYYNAFVHLTIDFSKTPIEVAYHIDAGPIYPLARLEVTPEWAGISPQQLGICLGKAATPEAIMTAEENLLFLFSRKGYPLARLTNREVIADQQTKEVTVKFHVDPGPLSRFGPLQIEGNRNTKAAFIKKKVLWRYSEIYDPGKIENTLCQLENAGIFSSINISLDEKINDDGTLPINLQVQEGKPRSIGLGVGYSTQRGPGFTAEWEHRNYRGMGEKLRLSANALKETQEGSVSYLVPDFLKRYQDLVYALELEHDDTKGYEKTSASLSASIERQLSPKLRVSYGGMYEYLKTTSEKENGEKTRESYNLARVPLKLRWSTVGDPLDPVEGATVFLKAVPSCQLVNDPFLYTITTLTASIYKPFSKEKRLIMAAKAQLGSILGSPRNIIPGSDRFYAGSENTLRGYNYMTVSPLSEDADPIGGRSQLIFNLEARARLSNTWGTVLFYDVGNVYAGTLPSLKEKMLQSVGVGIRYYTGVGPLRLDVAFPLNRRVQFDKKANKYKTIDRSYQIYFSVGQSF